MELPNDYNTYFDENGEPRPNPYININGNIEDGKFAEFYTFAQRREEIHYNLMSDKEKVKYDKMKRHLSDKMNS